RWFGSPRRSRRASRGSSWLPETDVLEGETVADGDRQFLLSVFLMEAWDTLAAVEDGLAALGRAPGEATTLESLRRDPPATGLGGAQRVSPGVGARRRDGGDGGPHGGGADPRPARARGAVRHGARPQDGAGRDRRDRCRGR